VKLIFTCLNGPEEVLEAAPVIEWQVKAVARVI